MNKINFKRKLILGSANFTQKYGADLIKINLNEIKKIVKLSNKNGISLIDTADSYLNEPTFFKNYKNKFKLVTKVKPNSKWVSLSHCKKKLDSQFKKLNKNKVQTLLFHDIKILFSNKGKKIFNNLIYLKKKKYFKKIGVSIYDTNCLSYLTKNYDLDVVQCPFNILDKRIISSGWFHRLKKMNIEIQARSIFLQGLLVNKKIYKKVFFRKWRGFFYKWFRDMKEKKISPIDYCLNDLLNYDFDKIIIGVNNHDNLKEILDFKLYKEKNKLVDLKINSLKLIDPRNWKKNEN